MKSVLFESILQESSVNEDEILRVTGMSISDIEDAFDCTWSSMTHQWDEPCL